MLFFGLLFLIYKSYSFRGKGNVVMTGTHKHRNDVNLEGILRENATLVMLVRYILHQETSNVEIVSYEMRCDL